VCWMPTGILTDHVAANFSLKARLATYLPGASTLPPWALTVTRCMGSGGGWRRQRRREPVARQASGVQVSGVKASWRIGRRLA
jgi:hypothetical protein